MNKTLQENCEEWVNRFNTVDSSLLERAFNNNIDDWCELTQGNKYYDSWLPMWGYLWNPDNYTESWILSNLQLVTDLGFRIFEDYQTGTVYLGIDGAGYDFYEAHWIPLYEACMN